MLYAGLVGQLVGHEPLDPAALPVSALNFVLAAGGCALVLGDVVDGESGDVAGDCGGLVGCGDGGVELCGC